MFGRRCDFKGCKISPLQMVILMFLTERPMYGYEVLKEARDHFEGIWTPQTGSIYPALKRLAESGLVVSEQRDGTDYYSLTDEGVEWVKERLRHAPKDIRLLSKYLELLGLVAAKYNIEGGGPAQRFSELFEKEENPDRTERQRKLKQAREHIAQHLADIDRELSEIDSEDMRKGGR
ncbi:MAG: PadR family transcriptional regulator [Methanomassiliicoccus sp.]|nr:PadR family transcriptional regulator [Methanomassiliicoccus sp.]